MKVNDLFLTAENVPCRLLLLTEDKRYQMPYSIERFRVETMAPFHEDRYKLVLPDIGGVNLSEKHWTGCVRTLELRLKIFLHIGLISKVL